MNFLQDRQTMRYDEMYKAPCLSVLDLDENAVICQSNASAGASTEPFEMGEDIDFD